jgi:hypothetical protein
MQHSSRFGRRRNSKKRTNNTDERVIAAHRAIGPNNGDTISLPFSQW